MPPQVLWATPWCRFERSSRTLAGASISLTVDSAGAASRPRWMFVAAALVRMAEVLADGRHRTRRTQRHTAGHAAVYCAWRRRPPRLGWCLATLA